MENSEANFCTNCGAQLQKGSKFCGNCGAPVKNLVMQNEETKIKLPLQNDSIDDNDKIETETTFEAESVNSSRNSWLKKHKKKIIYTLLGIGIIALGLFRNTVEIHSTLYSMDDDIELLDKALVKGPSANTGDPLRDFDRYQLENIDSVDRLEEKIETIENNSAFSVFINQKKYKYDKAYLHDVKQYMKWWNKEDDSIYYGYDDWRSLPNLFEKQDVAMDTAKKSLKKIKWHTKRGEKLSAARLTDIKRAKNYIFTIQYEYPYTINQLNAQDHDDVTVDSSEIVELHKSITSFQRKHPLSMMGGLLSFYREIMKY